MVVSTEGRRDECALNELLSASGTKSTLQRKLLTVELGYCNLVPGHAV